MRLLEFIKTHKLEVYTATFLSTLLTLFYFIFEGPSLPNTGWKEIELILNYFYSFLIAIPIALVGLLSVKVFKKSYPVSYFTFIRVFLMLTLLGKTFSVLLAPSPEAHAKKMFFLRGLSDYKAQELKCQEPSYQQSEIEVGCTGYVPIDDYYFLAYGNFSYQISNNPDDCPSEEGSSWVAPCPIGPGPSEDTSWMNSNKRVSIDSGPIETSIQVRLKKGTHSFKFFFPNSAKGTILDTLTMTTSAGSYRILTVLELRKPIYFLR